MDQPPAIPFNRPRPLGREVEYITDAFARGHISGDGFYTRKATELLERELGTTVLLTTSCTHALEMAALLLESSPATKSIVPSFTFVSTINAFVAARRAGRCSPTSGPDTLNLDERAARAARSRRGPRRSCPFTTPASAARWTRSSRWPTPRRRGRRRQRARPVRRATRTAARHVRRARDAELSRDEERHLRRGWRAGRQRRALRRARRDHPREGHEPAAVLPRRGRQVHLGRRRVELRAVGYARGRSCRSSSTGRDPGGSAAAICTRYLDGLRGWAEANGAALPAARL